jgi:hypothetical protein
VSAPTSSDAFLVCVRASPERALVAFQHDPRTARERDPVRARLGAVPERRRELGSLHPRRLDRVHLPERLLPEPDVAARLELELVQRALELEAAAVDRRRARDDRRLELCAAGLQVA